MELDCFLSGLASVCMEALNFLLFMDVCFRDHFALFCLDIPWGFTWVLLSVSFSIAEIKEGFQLPQRWLTDSIIHHWFFSVNSGVPVFRGVYLICLCQLLSTLMAVR